MLLEETEHSLSSRLVHVYNFTKYIKVGLPADDQLLVSVYYMYMYLYYQTKKDQFLSFTFLFEIRRARMGPGKPGKS